MKILKPLIAIAICFSVLILNGCQFLQPNQFQIDEQHMGCQEDEIDVNGECVPTEENNRTLFEKDVESTVDSIDINNSDFHGFLVTPKAEGSYPGIIMIHEWWGLNDNIKYMAKLLASEGYNVIAIDLYEGEVAASSDKAGELAGKVRSNPIDAVTKMQAAVNYLKSEVKSTKIASLGWCFGGQQSLNLSLAEPIDATVIYYGQLTDDKNMLSELNGPVLGIFGDQDGSITVESVKNFETALNELGINNSINIYEGVGHAFANPSGSNYAAEETIDAWGKTLKFLDENLK